VRVAICLRRAECVRALSRILQRGFGGDGPGTTPVMRAMALMDMECTEFLLDQGFDVGHFSADGVCVRWSLRASTARVGAVWSRGSARL
jgi:hypothetical protein